MAQRLLRVLRAKGKIRDANIPYRVPDETDLAVRIRAVLSVVYLIFNEGHTASSGDHLSREDLGSEAIRLGRIEPGLYQIQAAVNAVHSDAKSAEATDWPQIVALYGQLAHFRSTPIITLNRAVAVAEVEGPQAGLDLVDALQLPDYYLFHGVRADLLRRLGRNHDAALAYAAAIERSENAAERAFFQRRLEALADA